MMWSGSGSGTGGWWFMGVAMIAGWVLVAAVVVWLVRRRTSRSGQPSPPAPRTAGDVLDERCARGELTDEEYRQHRTLLRTG